MHARCIRTIGALGAEARHALVMEGEGDPALAGRRMREVSRPAFPSLSGAPLPGRLKRMAAAMAGYDLICTWGSGALDAAMAHTLFADVYKLPPLVHHEGLEGAPRSTLYRRLALGRIAALVVPSREAEAVALGRWQQPRQRVRLIPEGVNITAYAATPNREAIPGLVKRRGELWLGAFASSLAEIGPMMEAIAALPDDWQLVVVAEREELHHAIVAESSQRGIEHRVHVSHPLADVSRLIILFDLFASTSDAEGVLGAMAAGQAVAAPRGGEAASLLSSENGPYLADPAQLADAIVALAGDKTLRRDVGEANRKKARVEFDEKTMMERLRRLYRSLAGER